MSWRGPRKKYRVHMFLPLPERRCVHPGERFGRLIVLGETFCMTLGCGESYQFVVCECDCGKVKVVNAHNMRRGNVVSCGCARDDAGRSRIYQMAREGKFRKHGGTGTRLHRCWLGMNRRCNTRSAHEWKRYGGRGIQVCDEWNDFAVFREWSMTHGYRDSLVLDRIDPDGNYMPSNCRWVTPSENSEYVWKFRQAQLKRLQEENADLRAMALVLISAMTSQGA